MATIARQRENGFERGVRSGVPNRAPTVREGFDGSSPADLGSIAPDLTRQARISWSARRDNGGWGKQ
ncbi:MAG: hypothetical protein CHACPFDD_03569 [Phycisphaerae bacterium]|nr:hypothetical protein [Phycisphaerae bacterium]